MYKIKWLDNPAYVALPANLKGNVAQFIINKFKARWTICGYNLKKGWDYIESFTQVVSADANRILIATSVWFGTHLVSNDFQCFYLESEMVEDVYVEQPKGFVVVGREDEVCNLRAGVYGKRSSCSKQAGQVHHRPSRVQDA